MIEAKRFQPATMGGIKLYKRRVLSRVAGGSVQKCNLMTSARSDQTPKHKFINLAKSVDS